MIQQRRPIARRPRRFRSLAFLAVIAALLGCADDETTKPGEPDGHVVVKGFGISPWGFPSDWSRLADFFAEVGGMPHGAVMWNGPWRDDVVDGTDAGTIPGGALTVQLGAADYGFSPISVFGWRSGETIHLSVPADETNDWTNGPAKQLFQGMLVDFVTAYHPPFVFLGNENSAYYEQDPGDYQNWIAFYNSAYDAIKAAAPATMVGPVFNYEHLSGSGALNGWTTAHWEAIDLHDPAKVDVVGITLYPFLNHASATEVPSDYMNPLMARIGSTPIAITETGWPAEDLGPLELPWEESEEAQVAYLIRLGAMLEGKDVRIVNWTFLYPMNGPGGNSPEWELFGSVSVRNSSAGKRPVYDPWVAFSP